MKKYNYLVEVSADGYEDTYFEDYSVAREYYYKMLERGLNANFVEL